MEKAIWTYLSFCLERDQIRADHDTPLGKITSEPMTWSGGRCYIPMHLEPAALAYDKLFSFCKEKIETATPEDPLRYLFEEVFENKYFYEDYLNLERFKKERNARFAARYTPPTPEELASWDEKISALTASFPNDFKLKPFSSFYPQKTHGDLIRGNPEIIDVYARLKRYLPDGGA